MKYLKALLICIIFALMLVFTWQNKEILGFNLVLKIDFGFFSIPKFQMPVYLAIPLSFLLGALVSIIYGVFYNSRLYGKVRELKHELRAIQKEHPGENLGHGLSGLDEFGLKEEAAKKEDVKVKSPSY